ncbi:MAG: hypothetical protein A2017_10160 [Lentisphaerae bacterium GWF2_44_16]|nr:MAG: hypothetical protein A2017_10160 [Lentisphaerae bacterium GWF2_44_16]
MIDVNVSFGNWPFQYFSQDTPAKLSKHLKKNGIDRALVSSSEAAFFPDPDVCNKKLEASLKNFKDLIPVPAVNPLLENWENIIDESNSKTVKIFPGYHNYSLSSECVEKMIEKLLKNKMPLMIQMRIEDERSHHPLCRIPPVPADDVIKLSLKYPNLPIICLCAYFAETVKLLKASPNIYADISFAETTNFLARLLRDVPAEQLLFGSHTPFLYTKAAVMKIEYAEAGTDIVEKITKTNAEKLFLN